jgi:hypothetical protein
VNVADVEPLGTVTLEGTVADLALDVNFTTNPPAAGDPLRVTVPVDGFPPRRDDGEKLNPESDGRLTFNVAVPFERPALAVRVTEAALETGLVEALKVMFFCPAGTVTLEGTDTSELLLALSETLNPPLGAALFKLTVPVEPAPPTTEAGLSFSDVILCADATKQVAAEDRERPSNKSKELRGRKIISRISNMQPMGRQQVLESRIAHPNQQGHEKHLSIVVRLSVPEGLSSATEP